MQSDSGQPIDAAGPLWADADLGLEYNCFPLGFPLHINTNSPLVLDAARESWGASRQLFRYPPVDVGIGVSLAKSTALRPPMFRSRQHLFSIVADSDNSVLADLRSGYAFGW